MSQTVKPGYKQTEVGVIPVEWQVKCLREVATIATGNTPPTSDASNYGDEFPFVGPVDLGDAKLISKTEKMLSKKGFAMSRRFPKDSILFVSIGSTIGKCGIAPVELTSNQQINAIFPSTSFSVDYLFYAVSAAAPRIKAQAGEQAVPIVNKTQFSETAVALPPLPEQRAIATALSDVDALLAALDRLIAKQRDLKQAAMQQLLTGQTRLPGFTGKWETKRLGEVVQIHKGQLITSSTLLPGDVPVIAGGKQPAYFHAVANRHGRTITISASGASAGYVALYNEPIFASDCSTISEAEAYSLDFIYFKLLSIQQAIYKAQTGGAQPHIHAKDLNPIPVSMPPLPEQTAIATVLSDMDLELAALEQRRNKTRALKQGMMQELLTGRTRLV
jgi:type I restriction enzyme S subunit